MNNTLNVAVATDTILYAPFYLALYGGDFEDTPYGGINVNIIAQKGNPSFRFNGLPPKNADGFVTIALLFNYADIGICDPSFIIQISEDHRTDILRNALDDFQNSLTKPEKERFIEKLQNNGFWGNNTYKLENIREYLSTKIPVKIIGGLIQRNAFSVIANYNSDFEEDKDFTTGKFYIFNKPSTGYYYGISFNRWNIKKKEIAFGKEFDIVSKDRKCCALTCDYVAREIYKRKKKIKILKKANTNTKTFLFTAFLASMENCYDEIVLNKYKAFTYAIEKNLYQINQILSKGHINDLNVFFNDKLINSEKSRFHNNYSEIIKFLTSDTNIENLLLYDIKEDKKELKRTDEIKENVKKVILNYVEILTDWFKMNNNKGLYYNSIKINTNDLLNICKYRFTKKEHATLKNKLDLYIDNSLFEDWNNKQKEINKHHNRWYYKITLNKNLVLVFSTIFAVSSLYSLLLQVFNWNFINIKTELRVVSEKIISGNNPPDIWAWVSLIIIILVMVILIYFNIKFSRIEKLKNYVFNSVK